MAFPFYKQSDTMDCGPACMVMLTRHYGVNYNIQFFRDSTQIGKNGVNMLGLSETAEDIGFRTQACRLTIQSLVQDALLPCVLHWDQNHFAILYKYRRNKFYVADPAKGLMVYTPDEFKAHWISDNIDGENVGICLMLEPTPALQEHEGTRNTNRNKNIFSYLFAHRSFIAQLTAGLLISTVLQMALPFLTKNVVDVGVNTANLHFIYVVLFAQLALFAGKMAVEFIRSWVLLHISTRINIAILTDFMIKLMKLPISFFDSKKTGDILQRMSDHQRIESFLTGSSLTVLFSILNLVVFSFVLATFNVYIFFVFAISMLFYLLWVILFMNKIRILDNKKFEISSLQQSTAIQLIQGMQEIKLNGIEHAARWTWESLQARLFRLNMKSLSLTQWQQGGTFFLNEGKNILITFLSAKAVIDGQMTLGTMLAVQYIIGQLNSPIEQMIGFLQNWQNASISMERLEQIHSIEDEEPHNRLMQVLPVNTLSKLSGGYTLPPDLTFHPSLSEIAKAEINQSGIQFRDVSFIYPGVGNSPVLLNVSFTIPLGKITAIVGGSGSGKTTLLKLLLKFYNPQKGDIKLNNTSLSNISHRTWRKHCGTVMQESYIFSDSIAKNIAVGENKIDMERLQYAMRMANITPFIEGLPLGVNTKIGAEGMGISMGQKQRILIARAIYKGPDFVFLDEATNSLDAHNESTIIQNLNGYLQGKTVVIVAHRLSTVKHADQIVVLNNGRISERGTHQELLSLKGEYYMLVKCQLES